MQTVGHSVQNRLFPEVDTYTVYEQPLNERMRSFLRLEYLFQAIHDGMERDTTWDARNAIVSMIDISDQLSRADIKGELIKEVERHASILHGLRNNPGVNQAALESTLTRLDPLLPVLKSNGCQPGGRLRQSELITQIKQRIAIPGGTCNFDLPAFHHWLSRAGSWRAAQLNEWMHDLRIIEDSIRNVLKLVRDSAMPRKVSAPGGFYQQQLDASMPCQIVRVVIADADDVFPEISGGKHRFSVRFFKQINANSRPQIFQEVVWFELQCCGI